MGHPLAKYHFGIWRRHEVKMFEVRTKKPTETRKSPPPRWSDVWRDGDNLYALVEKKLGSPLSRNREIPAIVSERYQSQFFRMLYSVGSDSSALWRDLKLVDASVCIDSYNVGPRTILRLVSELADIAREHEQGPEDERPVSLSNDVLAAISELPFDLVVYAFYGGSPSGYTRLSMDSENNQGSVRLGNVRDQLLASDLQEAKQVLRSMAEAFKRCGRLLSAEQALRWMWDGEELRQILEQYGIQPTEPHRDPLDEFEDVVPILRARLTDGKSIREIARDYGMKEGTVRYQIMNWARLVPADLRPAFPDQDDSRVYKLEPKPAVAPPNYRYPFTPGRCLNCDEPRVTSAAPLYCSEVCRQAAKAVRYARACVRDGRIASPDIQEAIQMRVAHVLAGGYAEKDRRISPEARHTVMENAGGHCQRCGRMFNPDDSEATATIQHLNGSSSELSNLRAWCRRCNMADAQSRFSPVLDDAPESRAFEELRARWESPIPLRACDDDERWNGDWRRYARLVKAFLTPEAGGAALKKT